MKVLLALLLIATVFSLKIESPRELVELSVSSSHVQGNLILGGGFK